MRLDRIFDGLKQRIGRRDPSVRLGIDGANGSENLSIGPEHGKPQVGVNSSLGRWRVSLDWVLSGILDLILFPHAGGRFAIDPEQRHSSSGRKRVVAAHV